MERRLNAPFACSAPTRVYPLLKRHQAALLSVHTPSRPPFEENKSKLLISVRFIRWAGATGGVGVEQKGRGQQKWEWVWGGGGAVPRPPHSGPIMSATLKTRGPLILSSPSPCCLVWLSFRVRRRNSDRQQQQRKRNKTTNLSEGDTRIYDANLKESCWRGRKENPARHTKDSSRSRAAFNLTATEPHPAGTSGRQPITRSRLVPPGATQSEMGTFHSSRPGCGQSALFLPTEERQLTFPASVELDLS